MMSKVRSRRRRWRQCVTVLGTVAMLSFTGCKEKLNQQFLGQLCVEAGQCEGPAARGRDYRVLCDRSQYSPCDRSAMTATLKVLLPVVAKTPGSRLSLWVLTSSVGSTGSIAEVVSPAPRSKREREQRAEQERWVTMAEESLLTAADGVWKTPQPRKSYLAAALTKMAMVDSTLSPTIIAITDGLELEGRDVDFECGVLPGADRWQKMLHRQGWLAANSLSGTAIQFTFMQVGPQPRCGADIARLLKVRALWDRTLKAAGATVAFSTGVVQLGAAAVADARAEGGTL